MQDLKTKSFDFEVSGSEIQMDAEHTLDQLTSRFRTIKDGLPELVKNSKDHYARLGIQDRSDRQIVVIVSDDLDNLGILDFGGASAKDLDHWKIWSSKISGRREQSNDIEAGYGNGGKAFMVHGATKYSTICGFLLGKYNETGFMNNRPELKYRHVIVKDSTGKRLKEYSGLSVEQALNAKLSVFGIQFEDLPEEAKTVFSKRKSFTFVHLAGISEWKGLNPVTRRRLSYEIPDRLAQHAQSALTLETCSVWVQLVNHEEINGPLVPPTLDPFEGFESIPRIPIPVELLDPQTQVLVKTNSENNDSGYLEIKTSRDNLRIFDRYRTRNVVRVRNERNIIANWSVAGLVPFSASGFIYGTLFCPTLVGEHLSGSERSHLNETSLVRALEHWTKDNLEKISKQVQLAQSNKIVEENRDEASEILKRMRELMREYLNPNEFEDGISTTGIDPLPPIPSKHGKRIDEIALEMPERKLNLALGTTIPIVVRCYEKKGTEKLPVFGAKIKLCSDSQGQVSCPQVKSIRGEKVGSTNIWFESENGKVKSNKISVEVIQLKTLEILPVTRPLKQGELFRLDIKTFDSDGNQREIYYETYVDEANMAKFNRTGLFSAGGIPGKVTIRIKWGSGDAQIASQIIEIGSERIERQSGSTPNIPYILICGSVAPGKEDYSEDQRTHSGGRDYPTIIDFEPLWEGIVWINPESKESNKIRTSRGRAPCKISTKTFQQFLALKCFEVLKRLKVKEEFGLELKNSSDFFNALAQAEMETSGFLESSYSLVETLISDEELENQDE